MFANKRATACSNLLSMNSAQRNLTSYRSKQHRDTGELLALAAPPERLSSVLQHSRQTSRTLSQPNVCVFHSHRIFSLPERGTAAYIPRTPPHRFSGLYTHKTLLFTEDAVRCLPEPLAVDSIVQPAAASSLPCAQQWPGQTRSVIRLHSATGAASEAHGP